MEIDIFIDGVTDCLINRATGEKVKTKIMPISFDSRPSGWRFDWSLPEREGSSIFALYVEDADDIQGLLALRRERENKAVRGVLIESHSRNIGKKGKYKGIGAHLTAFGCKYAIESGFDLYYFIAKSELMGHYANTLGAVPIGSTQTMVVEGVAFDRLIETYFGKECRNGRE
jgi:hypothetical protein